MSTIDVLTAAHTKAAPAMGDLSLLIEAKRGLTVRRLAAIYAALTEAAKLIKTLIPEKEKGDVTEVNQ